MFNIDKQEMSTKKSLSNHIDFKSLVLLITIIFCSFGCEKGPERNQPDQVTETMLFALSWGSEKGLVGFLPRTESAEDQGPASFYVDQQGRIVYVLDTINRKINIYEGGHFLKEIKLVSGYYPNDIYVNTVAIYVLTDMGIEMLSHEGALLKSKKIVGEGRPLKRSEKIFKHDNTIVVSSWGDTKAGDFACFDDASLELKSCESIREIYVHRIIDVDSNNKFIAYKDQSLAYVSEATADSIGSIPDVEELYPSIRLFRVHNGKIYIMRANEKGVSFYVQKTQLTR